MTYIRYVCFFTVMKNLTLLKAAKFLKLQLITSANLVDSLKVNLYTGFLFPYSPFPTCARILTFLSFSFLCANGYSIRGIIPLASVLFYSMFVYFTFIVCLMYYVCTNYCLDKKKSTMVGEKLNFFVLNWLK